MKYQPTVPYSIAWLCTSGCKLSVAICDWGGLFVASFLLCKAVDTIPNDGPQRSRQYFVFSNAVRGGKREPRCWRAPKKCTFLVTVLLAVNWWRWSTITPRSIEYKLNFAWDSKYSTPQDFTAIYQRSKEPPNGRCLVIVRYRTVNFGRLDDETHPCVPQKLPLSCHSHTYIRVEDDILDHISTRHIYDSSG